MSSKVLWALNSGEASLKAEVVVPLLSHAQLFVTRQVPLSYTFSRSLLKLTAIESVMPSNHLVLCRPLLLLPSVSSSMRVFSNESVLCIRWPTYWSFSFNISPSNEHSGLISLGLTGWISLQSKGLSRVFSNTTVQKCSVFFIVQLSHPYMTTGKTITLTRQTFVGKVISLFFNMLSSLIIASLPRRNDLVKQTNFSQAPTTKTHLS